MNRLSLIGALRSKQNWDALCCPHLPQINDVQRENDVFLKESFLEG